MQPEVIRGLIELYAIEAVAIGNGTASRETETFVRELGLPEDIPVVTVNESGASVYSASPVAREEFPDLDLTVRGRNLHRAETNGPHGGTGENRPEVHRCGPVPA